MGVVLMHRGISLIRSEFIMSRHKSIYNCGKFKLLMSTIKLNNPKFKSELNYIFMKTV